MQCFHLKIQTRSLETAAFTRFLVMVVQSEKHPRGIWNSYKLQETPVPLQHVSWWDMTSWKNSFRCTTLGAHAQRVQHGRSQLQKRSHSFFIKIIQTITTKTEKEKKKTKIDSRDGYGASLVVQMVKNPPAKWETEVQSLGQEDPLEKGLATHLSILA